LGDLQTDSYKDPYILPLSNDAAISELASTCGRGRGGTSGDRPADGVLERTVPAILGTAWAEQTMG